MKRIKVLIVDRLPLDIKEESDDAVYHHSDKTMSMNLKECKQYAKEYSMNFYVYVARCINHEFLHYLLDIEQDYDTCHSLDKLCKGKHAMCIEYWLW